MKLSVIPLLLAVLCLSTLADEKPPEVAQTRMHPQLTNNIARSLRYWPVNGDFVITNGAEFFNRPLYYDDSAFRIDGGDKPEFSIYLPGRGGNLRFGVQTDAGVKWLDDADKIVTRYGCGMLSYEISDLTFSGALKIFVAPQSQAKGFVVKVSTEETGPLKFVWAFGGVNGMRGKRGGDIGCESKPVSKLFQLRPEECAGNRFEIVTNGFILRSKPAVIVGIVPTFTPVAKTFIADARQWSSLKNLLAAQNTNADLPVAVGEIPLKSHQTFFMAFQEADGKIALPLPDASSLSDVFESSRQHERAIANQVSVKTPDAFINAAVPALNIAANAVWDGTRKVFMHGAVAWRTPLLGWRGLYTGDALGWHNRTAEHFGHFAARQNTNPVPAKISPPDEDSHLARSEAALHSNGDLTGSHYDMNLVAVAAFFRHLLWTGDTNYARKMWPVIVRHLAWEHRLFRREFGPDKLPVYENYAATWASDNLEYDGGGTAVGSAYNYFENRMAARVAKLIGEDPAPYEKEADLILRGMNQYLWLADEGNFAEFKDYLGLQLVHPAAGLWSFYTPMDSGVPTPQQAWQMTRRVDTHIAHIPIRGRNVPKENLFVLPETSWMPYMWSLNNVVVAENNHTALGYWEANRPETAFALFKGTVLETMFLGLCPGNVGCNTSHDAARGEAQRDFADGIGITARALVEGLFGVKPDLLAGEVTLRPGFPAAWNHASIRHPDFQFSFQREGLRETYDFKSNFKRPVRLKLEAAALRDQVAGVQVNGKPAQWQMIEDSVGTPRILIQAQAAEEQAITIEWSGELIRPAQAIASVKSGANLSAKCDGEIISVSDPQRALDDVKIDGDKITGLAKGAAGDYTIFAQVHQGDLKWWEPLPFEIQPETAKAKPMDWNKPLAGSFETIDLAPYFNDRVTQIFKNKYRSPRSPFCSLAIPEQGIGGWAGDVNDNANINDSGLRVVAVAHDGRLMLPDGVPFATPTNAGAKNIIFTSQWDNYPDAVTVPLSGKSSHAFLLMAGSTDPMQSRFENGEVIVTYADGTTATLPLRNPETWWPIDQDYFIDDFAFRLDAPLPPRVDLKTGKVRILNLKTFKGRGGVIHGGAATVLSLPLDSAKKLKSLTVRTIANEVVIGLMSVTLQR